VDFSATKLTVEREKESEREREREEYPISFSELV
jgi:hypothetical protein